MEFNVITDEYQNDSVNTILNEICFHKTLSYHFKYLLFTLPTLNDNNNAWVHNSTLTPANEPYNYPSKIKGSPNNQLKFCACSI